MTLNPPLAAHTGRPRVINEQITLYDRPLADNLGDAELRGRLLRLLRLDAQPHLLCGEAYDLGLSASWIRLESVDDDIDRALAGLRAELRRRSSVPSAAEGQE